MIYTLADKDIMLHLLGHLNPLNEALELSIWHDDPIIPGQAWKTYFESRIHHTDIFLLLVSEDFMNSQFIEQVELKAVIDRHKENKSVVIPVILDNCQWDIDLKVKDYEFNLNELQVLPEEGRPIADWNSTDQAYNNVVAGVKKVLGSFSENSDAENSEKDEEKKGDDAEKEDHLKIGFTESGATKTSAEEEDITAEKSDTKKETELVVETDEERENRLWEEAEAKRRAEAANRLREAAAASAKRRDEEDKLWEEGVAKRKAEKEKRIREAAANPKAHEEQRLKEEVEVKKRAKEEQSRREVEQKRLKQEAEASSKRKAEQAKSRNKEVAGKQYTETSNLRNQAIDANSNVKSTSSEKKGSINKKILIGALVALLAIVAIWTFSKFDSGTEEEALPLLKEEITDVEDSDATETTKIDTPKATTTFSKLEVGDTYDGGIVFTLDQDGKLGKIAHAQDAGPMSWQNAGKIHEQLGDGWRMPTYDELEKMYQTIGQGATNSGQFADELYWSATAFDEYQARLLRFRDGNTSYHYNRNVEHRKFRVRAVRDFSQ